MTAAANRQDVPSPDAIAGRRFEAFTDRHLDTIPQLQALSAEQRLAMKVTSSVLPFRVNEYVINELIDWGNPVDDPIFLLTFPQRAMLDEASFARMASLHSNGADKREIKALATEIRAGLNPHPAGQLDMNRPMVDGKTINGIQHKYRETVLFFPSQGQTCHTYCSFCFRWAQFVGDRQLRIANGEVGTLLSYLRGHRDVTDLLITGGDPMVMKTATLERYLSPLLHPIFEHIRHVRIGTKCLTFWPYRFVTDDDADGMLRLFERLVRGGKHVALMAHYNHWRELETPIAREAIRRIRDTGVTIRSQGPILAHVNDRPEVWSTLWRKQVALGIVPYYLFVERDTGARNFFAVPLGTSWEIYRQAIQRVSGLGRTARGPSMSTGPGKVEIQGVTEIAEEKVFVLRFLQGRNPAWTHLPFFARYDRTATWFDDLRPAFGEERFFFEAEYDAMLKSDH